MCSSESGGEFFEATEREVEINTLMARVSSGSDCSVAKVKAAEFDIGENASGIDLLLLTFTGDPAKRQVRLHREKEGIFGVHICQILVRGSLLVSTVAALLMVYLNCQTPTHCVFGPKFLSPGIHHKNMRNSFPV